MIKINQQALIGYTLVISGNEGEEQLIISHSGSYDFKCKIIAHLISVDDGGIQLYNSIVNSRTVVSTVQGLILDWTRHGIPPLPDEAVEINKQIESVLIEFKQHFGY